MQTHPSSGVCAPYYYYYYYCSTTTLHTHHVCVCVLWWHSRGGACMSKDNRVPVYLDDEEKQQLVSRAQSMNVSQSEVVRRALLEFLDRDRADRIEQKVDRLHDKVDQLRNAPPTDADADTTHTHTHTPSSGGGGGASKTVQRAREIAQRIHGNHGAVVKDVDVKRAIEDVAGGDPRTMRKYKGMLRERGLLYEHPSADSVWTPDAERWAKWSVSYVDSVPSATLADICEEYPHQPDGDLFSDEAETVEVTP